MKEVEIVAVEKDKNVKNAVYKVLKQLSLPNLDNKTILLKPNVGRDVESPLSVNTNPEVVQAIYQYLKERYSAKFLLGDSPIISTDSYQAFIHSGYKSLMEEEGITWIDLDSKPSKTLEIPNGKIITKIKVTGYWDEIDYIISIPVIKMHMHTGATLSFKNCKGLIYKTNKIRLHHIANEKIRNQYSSFIPSVKELDIAIADLANVIQPNLSIIDGTYVMEGIGPSGGNPVELNTIIASTDYLAADIIALKIVQPDWTLEKVPHLKIIAHDQFNPEFSYSNIKTIPEDITPFFQQIEGAPKSISIKFKNVRLLDVESCSSCLSTVFMFLKYNKEFIDSHFTEKNPLTLVIGKGVNPADIDGPAFFIGNCTRKIKKDEFFINGCTPVQSNILKAVKKYVALKNNEKFTQ